MLAACNSSPPHPAATEVVEACARILSCPSTNASASGVIAGNGSLSSCVAYNVGFPTAISTGAFAWSSTACIQSAPSCDAVAECVYGMSKADCSSGSASTACTGNFRTSCFFGLAFGDDCAVDPMAGPSARCLVDETGAAVCGQGTCVSLQSSCKGTLLLSCENGIERDFDCAIVGASCGTNSMGALSCVGDGMPCAKPRCDNSTMVDCVGGHELRRDCAQMPIRSTCVTDAQGTVGCQPAPDLPCDPLSHVDRCDGAQIIYCDGTERSLDCALLSFTACVTTSGPAHCQ